MSDKENPTLEQLTKSAMGGDIGALYSLIEHPKTQRLLDQVSDWAFAHYKQDKDEIKEVLIGKLFNRIDTLSDPSRLKGWLYQVAKHHSLNQLRHLRIEEQYKEMVSAEQRNRFGTWHGESLVPPRAVSLPGDEHFGEEQQIAVRDMIQRATQRATESFPKPVVEAWRDGKSAREISEATGLPVAAVYRLLKKIQKAIVTESLSELEAIVGQMESVQSNIENEKAITRGILEVLRSK